VRNSRLLSWLVIIASSAFASDKSDAALAFLEPLRGESGFLEAVLRKPGAKLLADEPPPGASILFEADGQEVRAPVDPLVDAGVYTIKVEIGDATHKAEHLRLIRLVPFSRKLEGRIGRYEMGSWPYEGEKPPRTGPYAVPDGFVEVTRDNRSTHVSKHFKLEQFLTKGQEDIWPKYLVLDERLLDKLELIVQELKAADLDVKHVHIMSGFRTPTYNESGGDPRGRGSLSRHVYGDAADIWVDDDGDGRMDDLNGDRRIDIADAEVITSAAERVEARHRSLIGGIAPYPACCDHGPFAHIDARGKLARWRGPHQ
jgi:hypothetical protein